MQTCRVYSLSRLDFFSLRRSSLRFSGDFIHCCNFPTGFHNLNSYLSPHPAPQWLCSSSLPDKTATPKTEIITMWVNPSFWGDADMGTAMSGLRRQSPPQSDPFPREMQVPRFLMECLAASQARVCSLTLSKGRAPCFPQLGVELSSLWASAQG